MRAGQAGALCVLCVGGWWVSIGNEEVNAYPIGAPPSQAKARAVTVAHKIGICDLNEEPEVGCLFDYPINLSGNASGPISADQEGNLSHRNDGQSAGENGQPKRVVSEAIIGAFDARNLWGFAGGCVGAGLLIGLIVWGSRR